MSLANLITLARLPLLLLLVALLFVSSLAVQLIGPEYRSAISFGALFLILLVRPQGILGARA